MFTIEAITADLAVAGLAGGARLELLTASFLFMMASFTFSTTGFTRTSDQARTQLLGIRTKGLMCAFSVVCDNVFSTAQGLLGIRV